MPCAARSGSFGVGTAWMAVSERTGGRPRHPAPSSTCQIGSGEILAVRSLRAIIPGRTLVNSAPGSSGSGRQVRGRRGDSAPLSKMRSAKLQPIRYGFIPGATAPHDAELPINGCVWVAMSNLNGSGLRCAGSRVREGDPLRPFHRCRPVRVHAGI